MRRRRATFRPAWRLMAPGRPMRWWSVFALEVKARRIRHGDKVRLADLVGEVDARLNWQAQTTTTKET